MPSLLLAELDLAIKKPRICGAFVRAAEGTRTLDLLHGKQIIGSQFQQIRAIESGQIVNNDGRIALFHAQSDARDELMPSPHRAGRDARRLCPC
jgi:hypothetical protein